MRLGINVVSATDTVVNGDEKLRGDAEPKGTGRGGVVWVAKPWERNS